MEEVVMGEVQVQTPDSISSARYRPRYRCVSAICNGAIFGERAATSHHLGGWWGTPVTNWNGSKYAHVWHLSVVLLIGFKVIPRSVGWSKGVMNHRNSQAFILFSICSISNNVCWFYNQKLSHGHPHTAQSNSGQLLPLTVSYRPVVLYDMTWFSNMI